MTSKDLTPGQATVLASWMVPPMLKLMKLVERMKVQEFPPADPLYQKAQAAYEAGRLLRLASPDREPARA